jgi:hypothetical protein
MVFYIQIIYFTPDRVCKSTLPVCIENKLQYQSIFGSGILFNMVGSYIDSHRVILEEGTCLNYAICVCLLEKAINSYQSKSSFDIVNFLL